MISQITLTVKVKSPTISTSLVLICGSVLASFAFPERSLNFCNGCAVLTNICVSISVETHEYHVSHSHSVTREVLVLVKRSCCLQIWLNILQPIEKRCFITVCCDPPIRVPRLYLYMYFCTCMYFFS